jgi:hypothetical protein
MYLDSSYKSNRNGYPTDDIHPDLKGKEWHLKTAKAFYSSFMNNTTSTMTSDYDKMLLGRMYGAGKQGSDQYKDIIIGKKDFAEAERKAWANINFDDIISVAPKFRRIVLGIFESQEHEITATALDEASGVIRNDMKWKAWAQKEHKDILKFVDEFTNAKTIDTEYEPASIEELELYESMGGFKLKTEVAIEGALSYVEYRSSWKMIKEKLIGDAVDIGVIVVKDFTDIVTKRVLKKYVDPYNSVYTLDENKEVAKFGEIKFYTIANVRKETGMSEEELMHLAQKYSGTTNSLGNPYLDIRFNADGSINVNYDEFIVPVFEWEVASMDVRYKTTRTTKDGEELTFNEPIRTTKSGVKIGPKVWDLDNKKTNQVGGKVFRKGKWIIGTDEIWDWGLQYDMPRPTKDEVRSSYHVRKLDGVPMMLACKPHFDQIQLGNLRIQGALAMAPQAGVAYEFSAMSGMNVGGKGMDPMDIIKMHRQTGSFIYKATVGRGGMISPVSARPFLELKGGIGPLLLECVQVITMNLESVRDITGINQITDASSPTPEAGLGVSQLAVASTNNSLKPIYTNYLDLKEKSSENCCLRLQMVAKYNKGYYSYDKSIGKAAWTTLEEGADFTMSQMGIKIQALPTRDEIASISMALEKAIQAGRDGKPTLTMSEYFAIKRILLSGGGLKLAQVMLAHREQKRTEEAEKLQQDNMKLAADSAAQQEQVKSQARTAEAQQAFQLAKQMEKIKTDELIRLREVDHRFKMVEISAEGAVKNTQATPALA